MRYELAQGMFGTPGAMALSVLAILTALLVAAASSDLRHQRIPNRLVLSGAALALILHAALPAGDGFLATLPGALGLAGAVKGLLFGLLAFLPLYFLRAMGAGDVKLLAMVGAFLGPVDIWWALFFTFMAGGVLAIAVAVQRAVLGAVMENLRALFMDFIFTVSTGSKNSFSSAPAAVSAGPLPYGVAIAAGTIGAVIYRAHLAGLL
jgi:prepilin peptidase CpaA